MNERIKELFQQSSVEAFDHTVIGSNPRDYVCIYNKVFDPEKFAELIVRECMSRVRSRQMFAIEDDQNVNQAFDLLIYDIESHFGVEE